MPDFITKRWGNCGFTRTARTTRPDLHVFGPIRQISRGPARTTHGPLTRGPSVAGSTIYSRRVPRSRFRSASLKSATEGDPA